MSGESSGEWGERLAAAEGEMHPEGMSDEPPRREATYEDLESLPPNVVGELIGGELYTSPRPRMVHARVTFRLGGTLSPFDRDPSEGVPGGWVFAFEPELHLGRDVLVPDLAGWRRERLPELPDVAAMELAPDWVCEMLSTSTERVDRTRKMAVYAREGVKHLWLVDPTPQTLEVYRLESGRWSLLGAHGGAGTVHAEPFEALALELGSLWRR